MGTFDGVAGVPSEKGGNYYTTARGAQEGSGQFGQGVGQGFAADDGSTKEIDPNSGVAKDRSVPLAFAWSTGGGAKAGLNKDYGKH